MTPRALGPSEPHWSDPARYPGCRATRDRGFDPHRGEHRPGYHFGMPPRHRWGRPLTARAEFSPSLITVGVPPHTWALMPATCSGDRPTAEEPAAATTPVTLTADNLFESDLNGICVRAAGVISRPRYEDNFRCPRQRAGSGLPEGQRRSSIGYSRRHVRGCNSRENIQWSGDQRLLSGPLRLRRCSLKLHLAQVDPIMVMTHVRTRYNNHRDRICRLATRLFRRRRPGHPICSRARHFRPESLRITWIPEMLAPHGSQNYFRRRPGIGFLWSAPLVAT